MAKYEPISFELTVLKSFIECDERKNKPRITNSCLFFALLGFVLLISAYIVHINSYLSPYWTHLMCVFSGICISGAAIINKLFERSKVLNKYIDREAIKQRIKDLEM